jgi:ribose transport system permease protein
MKAGNLLRKYSLLGALSLLIVFFSIFMKSFFTATNLVNILIQSSPYLMMGLGLTVVMMAGEIDLSFAASIPLCSTLLTLGINKELAAYAVVFVLLVQLTVAGINSFFVVNLKLSSFVSTIATMFFIIGLNYALFGGQSIWLEHLHIKTFFDGARFLVPNSVIIVFAVFGLFLLFSHKTKYGRRLRAVGENSAAATSNGVNVGGYKFAAFVLSAVCYTLAVMLLNSRLSGSVGPSVGGNVLLPVMAIAFLGQTTFTIGRPNIAGVLIAGFFMGTVENALILTNVTFYYVPVIQGAILVAAIVLASSGRKSLIQIKFI